MKKKLARHKDKETFERIGFGIVTEDLDETMCWVCFVKDIF